MVAEDAVSTPAIILDTNVFVAAGFRKQSASAEIVAQVRSGKLRMLWSPATQRETRRMLQRIPPLSWEAVADLFRPEDRYDGPLAVNDFSFVADPDDRKFAALARATGGTLVTSDDHLLRHRHRAGLEITILTPGEVVRG